MTRDGFRDRANLRARLGLKPRLSFKKAGHGAVHKTDSASTIPCKDRDYDQAAGTGKARADVAEVSNGQTQLISNLLPYDKNSGCFGPYDFSLSEDGETLTCPAGKQSSTAYPSGPGDGRLFRFFACQCWLNAEPPTHMKDADLTQRCPLWKLCRDHRQGPGRTRQVFVSDYRGYVA